MRIYKSLSAVIVTLSASVAHAASTTAPTGKTAGFFDMGTFFNDVLTGDGGFAIIVGTIILGAAMLGVTGRFIYLAGAAGVALFLGFGVPVVTAVAGVTADIEMVDSGHAPVEHAVPAPVLPHS